MKKEKSQRELKLQKKLIPVNIIVCIIALVAALTLFLTPILKINVGKILRDERVIEFAEKQIDDAVNDSVEGTNQDDIDFRPVVTMIVKNVLGNADGEVSVSAVSAFRVLTGSGDKAKIVMDDLFFGEDALVTNLIESIINGVASIFDTPDGRALLEDVVISVMTDMIIDGIEDQDVKDKVKAEDVRDFVAIMKELGDPEKVPDGNVAPVTEKFIDKIESMLGDEIEFDDEVKQSVTEEIQKVYDGTVEYLTEEEIVSIESLICVNLSKNFDLKELDILKMLDGVLGGDDENEGSVHIKGVENEIGGSEVGTPETGNGEEGNKNYTVVTNYDDLLKEIGYGEQEREEIKEKLRTKLNTEVNKLLDENGVDDYLGYYEYIFFGMLAFIVPWLILFLFSFFHLLAKNKRFTMWYVKLICWIPPLIWLVLKLAPVVIDKVAPDILEGDNAAVVNAALSSISSFTWISGLCYVLLWLVSIFWAFPIKRKIRKERKNPEVEDAYGDE